MHFVLYSCGICESKMNRFEYARSVPNVDETIVAKCKGIKLYNGDLKVKQPNIFVINGIG